MRNTGKRTYRAIAALCIAIALTTAVTAAFGAFDRGDGTTRQATSIRGESFEYVTGGIYAYNPVRVVAEGVGWDYLTLFVAVPALLAAVPAVWRGSLRGRLIAAGVLGYIFYQYLMYAVFWALGPLLPAFIVLYAVALWAVVWIVSTIDVASLPARFTDRFPRRGIAAFCILMSLQLIGMWSQRIATGLSGDLAAAGLDGMPTLAVQALDLGIVVPLGVVAGVMAWRRTPWGYLLGTMFMVKAVSMSGAICAMLVSAWIVEGSPEVSGFAIFGTAALVSAAVAWRAVTSVRADEPSRELATGSAELVV